MLKFLKKTFFFVSIFFALLTALLVFSAEIAPVYPGEISIYNDLLESAIDVTSISLGNSHSMALSFEAMAIEGQRFWFGDEDLFEVGYKLNLVLPELPELKCVFVPMSYYVLQRDNRLEAISASRRRGTYGMTPYGTRIIENDLGNFLRAKLLYLARQDNWSQVVSILLGSEREPWQDRFDEMGYFSQDFDPEVIKEKAVKRAETYLDRLHTMRGRDAEIGERVSRAMEDSIALLSTSNIELILYTPPYLAAYSENFDREVAQEMRTFATELAASHSNVHYADYSEREEFINNYHYFLDDHMNFLGARAFSTRLAQDLNITSLCQ